MSAEGVGDLIEGLRGEDRLAAPATLVDGEPAGLKFVEPPLVFEGGLVRNNYGKDVLRAAFGTAVRKRFRLALFVGHRLAPWFRGDTDAVAAD